jgi:thiol-disulfide isomerase/thioredoxin
MKSHLLPLSLATVLAFATSTRVHAQAAAPAPAPEAAPAAPAPSPAQTEFKQLFDQIGEKLKAGQRTEAELAPEIKGFDSLIAKYAKTNPEEAAMISLMRARLYLEVFDNPAKAIGLLKQIKVDFPTSPVSANIDQAVASLEAKLAADSALAVGAMFPNIAEPDLDGKAIDLAAYKGKVVLIDFWATWCGPCVAELPNVIAAYEKYHAKGFEIIGISLDQSKDKLTAFTKEKNMTWRQYFDGLGWQNKVSTKYGIDSIPATFLLDGTGKIVAKDLRGDALDKKLAELLAK